MIAVMVMMMTTMIYHIGSMLGVLMFFLEGGCGVHDVGLSKSELIATSLFLPHLGSSESQAEQLHGMASICRVALPARGLHVLLEALTQRSESSTSEAAVIHEASLRGQDQPELGKLRNLTKERRKGELRGLLPQAPEIGQR